MASIRVRKSKKDGGKPSYEVHYKALLPDGQYKQKSKTFRLSKDAKLFKNTAESEELTYGGYREERSAGDADKEAAPLTLDAFWREKYVPMHGQREWQPSTLTGKEGLYRNYISPHLGQMDLSKITTEVIDKFYSKLIKEDAAVAPGHKPHKVTARTVIEIHKTLRAAFSQAKRWKLVKENPVIDACPPKHKDVVRTIWSEAEMMAAVQVCNSLLLRACINLALACTLRIGEVLGLRWDDITQDPASGRYKLRVRRELARVNLAALEMLTTSNDITVQIIPALLPKVERKTQLVLKCPKTDSSVRDVWIPPTVMEMILDLKAEQDRQRALLGPEYQDYNLVIAQDTGRPCEENYIRKLWSAFIQEAGLPKVTFHSLRHYSITAKLAMTGGDIKAVQGDSGHAVSKMVTDRYAHIRDETRAKNADLFESEFYARLRGAQEGPPAPETADSIFAALQGQPELLAALAEKIRENQPAISK